MLNSNKNTPAQTGTITGWKQPLAFVILALVIVYLRMPDRLVHGFLWAEDGKVFLLQAYDLGVKSLITPSAGYLHMIPRLIALAYSKVSTMEHACRPFAWSSAAVLCAACTYLFVFARKVVALPYAAAFGLAPILVPNSGEVWLTITNLQWVIAPALLVLLWEEFFTAEGTGLADIARGVAITLITLTGPFGLLFSPLVAFGVIVGRGVRRPWVAGAYAVALCLQLCMLHGSPQTFAPPGEPHHVLVDYLHFPWEQQFLHRMVLDLLIPARWAGLREHWEVVAAGCALASGFCLLMAEGRFKAACCALTVAAVGLWMMGVIRSGVWSFELASNDNGARYFYVPYVFLTWALILAAASSRHVGARVASAVMFALVLLTSTSAFRVTQWPAGGVVRHNQTAQLIVNPGPGWYIDLKPVSQ